MSRKVAYGGILLAVNVILLLLMNVIPINTLFFMGLSSIPISIIIMEWGPKSGVAFYVASIILGFIVIANKAHWILYAPTFGVYGLIKYLIEKDRPIYIEYIFKLLFANIVMILVYFLLKQFVYVPINLMMIIALQVLFLIYDYMYTLFIDYYNNKLRKIIKSL